MQSTGGAGRVSKARVVGGLLRPQRPFRWSGVLAALVAGSLLAGCETLGAGKKFSGLGSFSLSGPAKLGELPAVMAERSWPDAQGDVLGAWANGFGLVPAPQLHHYLNSVYSSIKAAAGVEAWPGKVFVIPTQALEAYSTGAGNVYLSLGWINSIESEDELAAILAHEFAHVYGNTHQLESSIVDFNRVAAIAGVGMLLAKGGLKGSGLPDSVTNFAMLYVLGRQTLTPAWSRSEERDADRIGLILSQKLNYSFVHGFKAFLERQASWEEQEAAQRKLQEQALKAAQSSGGKEVDVSWLAHAIGLPMILESLAATHPDSNARLEALIEMVAAQDKERRRVEPRVQPWKQALKHKETAALLRHYEVAFTAEESFANGDMQTAYTTAAKVVGALGPEHALPSYLYAASAAKLPVRPAAARKGQPVVAEDALSRSLRTSNARAWKNYALRISTLQSQGRSSDALTLLKEGHSYFSTAPATWPQVVALYGQLGQWSVAKQTASQCGKQYPSYMALCDSAARTPAEVAEEKRQTEARTKAVADKLFRQIK